MNDVSAWVGRSEERVDRLDPARSNALLAALNAPADRKDGDALPHLHHWLHFWEATTPEQTGPDGHPKRGGFLPPVEQPRRMWASGQLDFLRPLRLGTRVSRRSTIRAIEQKHGKSGSLVFVTVDNEVADEAGPAIRELQHLVYRDAAGGPPAAPPAAPAGDPAETLYPDPVLLFRYSALTMNAHRIHYDRPYAEHGEGYAGLVVQGPLQATLLLALAERQVGRGARSFRFRGVSPAFAETPLGLHAAGEGNERALWSGQLGRTCMTATALF